MVLQRIYYVLVCVLVMLQQPGLLTSSSSFSLAYSMPVSSVAARNNALPLALNSMRGSEKPVSSRPELDFSLSLHHALILRGGNRCHWLQTSLSAVSPLQQDFLLTTAVVGETMIWLKLWTWIAKKGLLSSLITRKIIHSFSAPLFLLHWPFFHAGNPRAALVASVIPLLQIIKLYLAGISDATQKAASDGSGKAPVNELVAAVSRTGTSKEALGGPLIYSVVLFLTTLLVFRQNPVGLIAVCQMAAGDGLADIFGRQFGKTKWWFSSRKSIVGTLAFVGGGFLCSLGLMAWFMTFGFFPSLHTFTTSQWMSRVFVVSLLSAAIELLETDKIDDNISVPVVAALSSYLLLVRQ